MERTLESGVQLVPEADVTTHCFICASDSSTAKWIFSYVPYGIIVRIRWKNMKSIKQIKREKSK